MKFCWHVQTINCTPTCNMTVRLPAKFKIVTVRLPAKTVRLPAKTVRLPTAIIAHFRVFSGRHGSLVVHLLHIWDKRLRRGYTAQHWMPRRQTIKGRHWHFNWIVVSICMETCIHCSQKSVFPCAIPSTHTTRPGNEQRIAPGASIRLPV